MHLKPMIVFFILINSVVPLCTMENTVDEKTEEKQSNLKKSIYTFHTSMLPLQPGLSPRFVDLGYPYASITQTEKKNSIYLQESNYTFFNHETDGNKCVIIGPLEPCFMLVLTFSMLCKTFIAHVAPNSEFGSFLIKVLEYIYSNTDREKYLISEDQVSGQLFTNECRDFNKKMFASEDLKEFISYADITGYEDQLSWLTYSRELICDLLNIRKDTIKLRMFPVEKQLEPKHLGHFPMAASYFKITFDEKDYKPVVNNTCVIFEGYFNKPDSLSLSLKERYEEYEDVKKSFANPAYTEDNQTSEGTYNFVYVSLED